MKSVTSFSSTSGSVYGQPESKDESPAELSASERNELLVAGVIGEQLSAPLAQIDEMVRILTETRSISGRQLQLLRDNIDQATRIAMQSQQVARLAGGQLRQSHERLGLHTIVNKALDERAKTFRRTGIELYRHIKAVEVIVDPGLLFSLVEAAIDWAAERGQRLTVSLEMKNWPEHGMLMFKASQSVALPSDDENEEQGIGWYLMGQIARTMGVALERVSLAGETILMLEFARTVKQLQGLTAVEVDGGGDSSFHSDSKPLAGHRVLLVTTDEAMRREIKFTCRTMGLVLDTVPTTRQAVQLCELDMPHMVLIDERLRDAHFDQLHKDMQRYDPNLPFIEIADQPNILEMASWISGSMTRVSRASLDAQLGSILVFELAKVV